MVASTLPDQPAGAGWRKEEEKEEGRRRECLDAEHPSPFNGPEFEFGDDVVREEGQQDAEDDVELGNGDQTSTQRGR